MKKLFSHPLFHLAFVLFLVLGFEGYSLVSAQYYSPANQPPIDGTSYPPLDTGSSPQIKSGSLYVGDTSANAVGLINDGSLGFWATGTLQSKITYDPASQGPIVYNNVNGSFVTSTLNSGWSYSNGALYYNGHISIGTGNFQNAEMGIGASNALFPLIIANKATSAACNATSTACTGVAIGVNGIVNSFGKIAVGNNVFGAPSIIYNNAVNTSTLYLYARLSPYRYIIYSFTPTFNKIKLSGDTPSLFNIFGNNADWVIDENGDFYPDFSCDNFGNCHFLNSGGKITAGTIEVKGDLSAPDRVDAAGNFQTGSYFAWGSSWTGSFSPDWSAGKTNEVDCPDGMFLTGIRLGKQSNGSLAYVIECHYMFPQPGIN